MKKMRRKKQSVSENTQSDCPITVSWNTAHTAPKWVSQNTAPRRNTCLGFNWISRKCGGNVEETLNTSNGANLRRGKTSSYPPFASASSAVRAVYAVRAVRCFVTPHRNTM